jgi:ATP-binding cassette subfamily A (ABC1) protein 3
MTWLKKFCVVLWKNYVIRKRHWILTLLEIVIPVLLFIVVVLIRLEIGPSDDKLHPVRYFDISNEDKVIEHTMTALSDNSSLLLYAPQNNFTTKIMSNVSSKLKKDGK